MDQLLDVNVFNTLKGGYLRKERRKKPSRPGGPLRKKSTKFVQRYFVVKSLANLGSSNAIRTESTINKSKSQQGNKVDDGLDKGGDDETNLDHNNIDAADNAANKEAHSSSLVSLYVQGDLALHYYEDESSWGPKGWYLLSEITHIHDVRGSKTANQNFNYEKAYFVLRHPNRTLRLKAYTQKEHRLWLLGLTKLCPHANVTRGNNEDDRNEVNNNNNSSAIEDESAARRPVTAPATSPNNGTSKSRKMTKRAKELHDAVARSPHSDADAKIASSLRDMMLKQKATVRIPSNNFDRDFCRRYFVVESVGPEERSDLRLEDNHKTRQAGSNFLQDEQESADADPDADEAKHNKSVVSSSSSNIVVTASLALFCYQGKGSTKASAWYFLNEIEAIDELTFRRHIVIKHPNRTLIVHAYDSNVHSKWLHGLCQLCKNAKILKDGSERTLAPGISASTIPIIQRHSALIRQREERASNVADQASFLQNLNRGARSSYIEDGGTHEGDNDAAVNDPLALAEQTYDQLANSDRNSNKESPPWISNVVRKNDDDDVEHPLQLRPHHNPDELAALNITSGGGETDVSVLTSDEHTHTPCNLPDDDDDDEEEDHQECEADGASLTQLNGFYLDDVQVQELPSSDEESDPGDFIRRGKPKTVFGGYATGKDAYTHQANAHANRGGSSDHSHNNDHTSDHEDDSSETMIGYDELDETNTNNMVHNDYNNTSGPRNDLESVELTIRPATAGAARIDFDTLEGVGHRTIALGKMTSISRFEGSEGENSDDSGSTCSSDWDLDRERAAHQVPDDDFANDDWDA
jgi:hypothetical protein